MKKFIVSAYHLGQKINVKSLIARGEYSHIFKEPAVIEIAENKYVVLFRYGVVVFWHMDEEERENFIRNLQDDVVSFLREPEFEKISLVIDAKKDEVKTEQINLAGLSKEKVALVSIVLSRSIVLDYFERKVTDVLDDMDEIMRFFAERGRSLASNKILLQKAGIAMNIKYVAMNQMAMLEKPDLTWEDQALDRFYSQMAEEYELEERYKILNDKLKMLFSNVDFVLNYIEGRRALFLELIIVFLIVFEIVIFFVELLFL